MELLVGTRTGLFTLVPGSRGWAIDTVEFLGEPVTAAVVGHDGATYAALGTGHFGSHIWRREPGGRFTEGTENIFDRLPPVFPDPLRYLRTWTEECP